MTVDKTKKGGKSFGEDAAAVCAAGFGYGFTTAQDPPWTVDQVVSATGGRLFWDGCDMDFRSVSIDSRSVQPGDLFLALRGERYDGHSFVGDAVGKGAAGLVVETLPQSMPMVPVVRVEDSARALGDLAAFRRARLPRLKVVAITGSSGKTTVKEMTAAVLKPNHTILKTKGNFNNLIGLPLSLLPAGSRHEIAVLEMGMNYPGEIARLTEIARPDIACILNVQGAHLEGLKTIEGVASAKGELFEGVAAGSILVVNADDRRVLELGRRHANPTITFGLNPMANVRATYVRNLGEEGMAFRLHIGGERESVTIKALGRHSVQNALAAAAISHACGIDIVEICRRLAEFHAFDKRLQIIELPTGLKVVNDSYNANPASMKAALQTVRDLRGSNRVVAVLGDMLELGRQAAAAHRELGETVAGLGYDYLLTHGSFAATVAEAARKAGMAAGNVRDFQEKEEISAFIRRLESLGGVGPGDWILVKGSRSMQMETVVRALSLAAAKEVE